MTDTRIAGPAAQVTPDGTGEPGAAQRELETFVAATVENSRLPAPGTPVDRREMINTAPSTNADAAPLVDFQSTGGDAAPLVDFRSTGAGAARRTPTIADELRAVAILELGEVLRSRWLLFSTTLYAALAALFVLVGLRESSLFGFTGMGRVLFSFCHALVVLLPLLALTATGQVVGRARDDGTLELLLSHPIRRAAWFWGVAAVRYAMLVVPLAGWMIVMTIAGRLAFGDAIPLGFVARAIGVSASLLLAFVGIGLAISTSVRNPAKALMLLLVVWASAVALLDVGLLTLMLQYRVAPRLVFLLAAANPVESARLALLAGADASLGVLGPVGFYLAHRVGDGALVAIGLAWPALVGAICLGIAARRFARGDLV